MAASASGDQHSNTNVSQRCSEDALSQPREMIKPSVLELTKEVRKNILCTVEGCGKILPNTPALNMHLVKSHRVKDGVVNWSFRKDMKGGQKLYCCPIEGCPRGPNRPFSQFSLVKQHFMKMHAEKKHKCSKCSNGYSTEWDLRRHAEHCGKTYRCTCGCPYASRTSLLSHVYRTGHEVPSEHRYPPVKKRKMDKLTSGAAKVKANETTYQILSAEVVLVNVPVMQLAQLPVLLPSAESGALRSVVLTVDGQGPRATPHLLPQPAATATPHLDAGTSGFKEPTGAGERVMKSEPAGAVDSPATALQRGRSSTSTDIQTDISYLARGAIGTIGGGVCPMGESSVSSCSQTDISVSAQVLLPVSVETQTFPSKAKVISTIGAQTDRHSLTQPPFVSSSSPSLSTTRKTQTVGGAVGGAEERARMDQAMASHLFDCDSLSVSTQTSSLTDGPFRTYPHHDSLAAAAILDDDEEKSAAAMCFGAQTDELQASSVADNQTQTQLFNDLENILSHGMAGHQGLADWLGGADAPLESLDIQTQTDFLLLEGLGQGEGAGRGQSDLELEMFDTQTQTDLNLFLTSNETQTINMDDLLSSADLAWNMESHFSSVETQTDLDVLRGAGGHMPLSSILRQSGFSISTESSDSEMQTDLPSLPPPPPHHHAVSHSDQTRPLSSAETQTGAGQWECLGNLFLTSIETQTVMDDNNRGPPGS